MKPLFLVLILLNLLAATNAQPSIVVESISGTVEHLNIRLSLRSDGAKREFYDAAGLENYRVKWNADGEITILLLPEYVSKLTSHILLPKLQPLTKNESEVLVSVTIFDPKKPHLDLTNGKDSTPPPVDRWAAIQVEMAILDTKRDEYSLDDLKELTEGRGVLRLQSQKYRFFLTSASKQ